MNHSTLPLLLALASAGLLALPANAEDAPDGAFEEVIVTAKKRAQSIYEVPAAISAFTQDSIERQGITDLIDIGKFVPNLNVTGFSAGHTSSANPFIRGIGLQDHLITTDPGVGVYVDGVYLGRQVGQNWSLKNIERVEVLRGPQGTLYGRNSIGGAINIITAKPGDEDRLEYGLRAGSRGRLTLDAFVDRAVSDTVSFSAGGAFTRRDGLGDFVNVSADKDVGELQDISGRIALAWKASDKLDLLFAFDGNRGENGLRPYTTLIDELPNGAVFQAGFRNSDVAANPYDNNTGQRNQTEVTNEAWGLSLTADYAVNDNTTAKMIFSHRESEYESGLDDDGFVDDFLSFPEEGQAEQTSIELQLNGEYGQWDYVAGVYLFDEEGDNDQDPTIFLGGPGDFFLEQDAESRAVYGNIGFRASDDLRLSAGLRYTRDKKDARVVINSGLIDFSNDDDWTELSWDLSFSWDFNDAMSLYGTIANGYQSGQFPPRPFCLFGSLDFSQPGNVSTPNCFQANKDNITAVNYEVGIKGEPTENLQLSVATFYTEYSDLPYQVSTTSGGGFDTRNIIVDQDSFGVELESSLRVTDGFYLNAAIGYIDVDVDDPVAVAPLTPEWTLAVSPEYTVGLDNGGTLNLRADWSWRDDMFGEPTSDKGRFTAIDSREIINFDISYENPEGSWTFGLYGRNVTDERYDNARLNVGDYVLVILSNDASEFGVRFTSRL